MLWTASTGFSPLPRVGSARSPRRGACARTRHVDVLSRRNSRPSRHRCHVGWSVWLALKRQVMANWRRRDPGLERKRRVVAIRRRAARIRERSGARWRSGGRQLSGRQDSGRQRSGRWRLRRLRQPRRLRQGVGSAAPDAPPRIHEQVPRSDDRAPDDDRHVQPQRPGRHGAREHTTGDRAEVPESGGRGRLRRARRLGWWRRRVRRWRGRR